MIVFAFTLAAAVAPTPDDARFITSIVASAVSEHPRVDVITQEDVRKAVAVEAERQSLGCSEQSCLAEVASAMGARIVVFGSVGTFADEYAVEVSAFDADTASSLGRSVLNGPSLKEVAAQAKEKAAGFRDRGVAAIGAEGRLRVLVLDFELRNAAPTTTSTTTAAPPSADLSGLQWVGLTAGGLAAIGLVVGVAGDQIALDQRQKGNDLNVDLKTAQGHYEQANYGVAAAIGGYASAAVLGAAAVVLFLVGGADEAASPAPSM